MMLDFNKIKTIYNLSHEIGLEDVMKIFKMADLRSYEPKEYLITEGSYKREIFYIWKGLVRKFVVNNKGDEITTLLRLEHQIVASQDIILFDQPSKSYCEAIEPTKAFVIDYDRMEAFLEENPKLESNRKHILRTLLRQVLQRVDSFVLLSPEERYLAFIANNPDIMNRAPNKYIANVLGITPVPLSRIRKRIASKKR